MATEPITGELMSGPIHDLVTARVPVAELHTFHRNPRRGDVAAIARSLAVQGQYRPIVVNRGTFTLRRNEVLAGNHTLMAARELGWSHITVCWVDVDDDQAARIVAADNRTADMGGYDDAVLAELLGDLSDLDGTGYTDADLAALLAPDEGDDDPDDESASASDMLDDGVFTRDEIVESAARHVEECGPPLPEPWPVYRCMTELNRLRAGSTESLQRSNLGLPVADTYHPHRFAVRVDGRSSLADVCARPDVLRHGVRFAFDTGKLNPPSNLRHTLGFARGCQIAANFRPGYALHLMRRFAPAGGTMLDTSTGFGGRLVGFLASDLAHYVGIDPNPLTHKANDRLVTDLGLADRVTLINQPAEDVDADSLADRCDFAFTSPPYFTKERYAEDDTQSCVRYPEPALWRNGFLVPTLALHSAALKTGALNLINIADVKTPGGVVVPLVEWTIDAAKSVGFDHVDTEELPLERVPGANNEATGGKTGEPVLIFRKL